ncbi:nucleotide-binding protein [Marinobacterium zhoushanense]|uniref:Nucleotide-binding protein n=1 Tax=Marinobacterium zhoushanense TaxID=1679163 RepID=A0ABQ1K4E8_9GAMM|nr:RNase adapter RapZ [Marinobacterium zhoushanense]GGB83647.1 nucleotide-binding protein [Marinobacterium zhoushanense]
MKLVVISGRSGSGKSTALQALEDVGFYCIDNLPARLLPELIEQMLGDPEHPDQLAVSIDARNLVSNLHAFPGIITSLSARDDLSCEILYLDAAEPTLIKRYSATRRKHPLSDSQAGLQEAIGYERILLEGIASLADIRVDTTRLSLYELRDTIKLRIAQRSEQTLSLQFESFGFKHGVPLDVDFTFDVRMLPNPYWVPELRQFTGRETEVIEFLQRSPEVDDMIADIRDFLERWIPHFQRNNRSYVTIGIGCTGGQHRSVYIAEQLAGHFSQLMDNVHVRHRELT